MTAHQPRPEAAWQTELTGLTWSHPRGSLPLRALAREAANPGALGVEAPGITWSSQPLAGFEAAPISDLAAQFDVLVVDHPGLGAAVTAGALRRLDELLPGDVLGTWRAESVGSSFDSYSYGGHQWAAPIDAATQVTAFRGDLLARPPAAWPEVLALSPDVTLAIPTGGPHAVLTFLGIAAAVDPGFASTSTRLVPRPAARAALQLLRQLYARTPPSLRDQDPIQILDAMTTERIALCPLVYSYVNYSTGIGTRTDGTRLADGARVTFTDAPAMSAGGVPGSVLGGTGIAISSHTADPVAAIAHIHQVMSHLAQTIAIPVSGGQPSAIAAWENDAVNRAAANFYRATRRSQDTAWTRPRFAGWIAVQAAAAETIREYLRAARRGTDSGDGPVLDAVDAIYRRAYQPEPARFRT